MGFTCAARSCKNRSNFCKKRFFRFPQDTARARIWAIACNRKELLNKLDILHQNFRICQDHFERKMFTNKECQRLNPTAVPSLFPLQEGSSQSDHNYTPRYEVSTLMESESQVNSPQNQDNIYTFDYNSKQSRTTEQNISNLDDSNMIQSSKTYEDCVETSRKKKNRCCVQGCDDLVSSRHHFPRREPDIFEAWVKIVKPPGYESLSADIIYNKYSVCDIHFRECDRVPKMCKMRGLSAIAIPLLKIPGLDSKYAETVVKEALEKRDRNCISSNFPSNDGYENIAIEFPDNYISSYQITDSSTNEEFLLDETTGLSIANLMTGRMVLHLQMTEDQFENHVKIDELPKCGKCRGEAVGKLVIHCDNGCQKPFHISCVELSKQNFGLLKMIDGAMWFCPNCRKK